MKGRHSCWLAPAAFLLDRFTKLLACRLLTPGRHIEAIPGLFRFTLARNTGAAFSMLSGRTALLSVVSALLLAAVSVIIWRSMCLTRAGYLAFACLLGGGIGNLIDRMLLGGVTDYIRLLLFRFPVFNLADIAITMSIAVLMLLLLRGRLEENEHHG